MARMYTTSSGTGDLDLFPVAGEAPYSGNDAVEYSIHTPLGAYETGTASVVGGKRLVGRTVVTSSNGDALISVPQPPTSVSIYLTEQVASVDPDGGAGLVDADYGDITVSGDGTVMTFAPADPSASRTALELTQSIGGAEEGDVPVWDGAGFSMERQQSSISFRMGTPVNGTEVISDRIGFEGVPIGLVPHLDAGTCSLTVSIDGVAIPGLSAVPVTTTRTLTDATVDLDPWTATSYMTFTLASVTGASKFSASLIYKRVR